MDLIYCMYCWLFKCVCGDLPKEESVVWSLSGINPPTLMPESQSQSTPNSAGGLFTQPHKSISKSQKPAKNNTDAHRAYSHVQMPPLLPLPCCCCDSGH